MDSVGALHKFLTWVQRAGMWLVRESVLGCAVSFCWVWCSASCLMYIAGALVKLIHASERLVLSQLYGDSVKVDAGNLSTSPTATGKNSRSTFTYHISRWSWLPGTGDGQSSSSSSLYNHSSQCTPEGCDRQQSAHNNEVGTLNHDSWVRYLNQSWDSFKTSPGSKVYHTRAAAFRSTTNHERSNYLSETHSFVETSPMATFVTMWKLLFLTLAGEILHL